MSSAPGGGDSPAHEGKPTRTAGSDPPSAPSDLAARLPLKFTEIDLGRASIGLFTLPDPDVLLDAMTQEEFDRNDGRMPYWAVLWPSAIALARIVLEGEIPAGRRVLDLGCGLGLAGIAALHRGADVTFFDWEASAVRLARASAYAGGFSAVSTVAADWRAPPPLAPFDLVLGADVLYEARNGPAVAAFLARHVVPGGEAWIVDPDRLHAKDWPADLARVGLTVRTTTPLPPAGDATRLTLRKVARA